MTNSIAKLIVLMLLGCHQAAWAAVSIEHWDQLSYYDWLEDRGYDLETEDIFNIGDWNQRELEGHWPEVDYSYWEWEEDWY